MLHHAILLQNLVEHRQRPAAIDHVVLGDDLEPVDHRFSGEDVVVVRNAQSDADAVFRETVKAIGWHDRAPAIREV